MAQSFPFPFNQPEGSSGGEDSPSDNPFTPEPEIPVPPTPPSSSEDISGPPRNVYVEQPLSKEEERTWAMLAHLSILINLVTGFLGPVVAILIYAVYRERSRYVAYHAMQSFVFQLITWVGAGIIAAIAWTLSGLLAVILVGCLLMPLALLVSLVPLAALVYGVVGAVQVNNGQDFRYPLVGDWVRGTLTG